MFKKNDPLVESVKKIMEENELRRRVEARLCEELGIASRKALPFEHHANYDALLEQRINEATDPSKYSDKQKKLAAVGNKAGIGGDPRKIDAPDLAGARKGHASHIEEEQLDETSEKKRKEYKDKAGRSVSAAVLRTGLRSMVGMKSPSDKDSDTIRKRVQGLTRQARASKSPEDASDAATLRYKLGVSEPRRGKGKLKEEDTSSSHPDFKAPRAAGAPTYKDEIKYKEEPKSEMPKNPPMPPKRPANLEETSHMKKIRKEMDEANLAGPETGPRRTTGSNQPINEKAPPEPNLERMIRHIKANYSKDGKLTKKEKSIAYATAWKAKNKEDK